MTVSRDTLVWRVKGLMGNVPNFQGTITGSVTNVATTVPVNDGTDWAEGDVLEFEDGDLCYVESVATNNLTVIRDHLGSTGTAHNSGDVVYKNPTVYIKDVKDALDLTLKGLWPYIWKVTSDTITPADGTVWYDLAADAIDIVSAYQLYGASLEHVGSFGAPSNQRSILVRHNLPTALVASGVGVAFPGGFFSDEDVNITYRAKLTGAVTGVNYTEISDGVEADCITYGAAARLVQSREATKVLGEDKAQGEVNTDAGDRLTLWTTLQSKYTELRNNWHDELYRTKPGAGILR